ncbi:sensor histidine kinase [Hymenobacter puniceus]|uniref:sensor histidine kinase n=1 Tax=Hymenobacter sp. BT190 TaxID=2763505 RepID=UPI0016515CDF|nr:ATP-binding protein [Hymenobacter sp. BT190]MBC6700015.1 two-component sensor histidine kinase [Hymenobacter sp. BT190]
MPDALLPFLLIGPVLLLLVGGIIGILVREQRRRLQQEREKHLLLEQQNELLEQQVQQRTADLQQSLRHLQATQRQLIQSEKLASLGELTAGVAHEIQNPLNFVLNFSEVSVELVQELKDELLTKQSAANAASATELLQSLEENLQRITQHGQRAGGIVQGMLLHARNSTGERQPTHLNELADQFLRLAYQGMRAKHKEFNVAINTDFAPNMSLISVAPQDIGRVLLNLFNNALYALRKRQQNGELGYRPLLQVMSACRNGQVELRVRDNGSGIDAAILEKIYQPFFTTKPTGEGSGLGLSISYDIVTQGHGGQLLCETKEGEYTEFILRLPA